MAARRDGTAWVLRGILCPVCGKNSSRVVDSREGKGFVRRRRECTGCSARWSTVETITGFLRGFQKARG